MCSSLKREVALKLGDIRSFPGFATESVLGLEQIIYIYIYTYVYIYIFMCIDTDACVCAYTKREHKVSKM